MASSVTHPSHVRYNVTQISLSHLIILTTFTEKRVTWFFITVYNFLNSDLTSQVHIFSPVYALISQCQTKFHTHIEHLQRVLEVHVQPTTEYTKGVQTVLHLYNKCKRLFIVAKRQIPTTEAHTTFHWNLTDCLPTYDVWSSGVSWRRQRGCKILIWVLYCERESSICRSTAGTCVSRTELESKTYTWWRGR